MTCAPAKEKEASCLIDRKEGRKGFDKTLWPGAATN